MLWVVAIAIIAIALFFLLDTGRMKRMQSEIRAAYLEDALPYDEANKVAWYLMDMFIYMRKKKDRKLANMVMKSTMTVFRQRLYNNQAYEGNFAARMQMEGIRDACLVINRPVIEAADLMYSSVVASYEGYHPFQNNDRLIIPCPRCSQQLRVPGGYGTIRVTCPSCRERFEHHT